MFVIFDVFCRFSDGIFLFGVYDVFLDFLSVRVYVFCVMTK